MNRNSIKESNYKMWGGKYMAYSILGFFAFIFIILLINSATRYAVLSAPVWFVIMLLMYQKYKKNLAKLKLKMRKSKALIISNRTS